MTENNKPDAKEFLEKYLIEPLVGMFDEIFENVRRTDNKLITFQKKLKEIPAWKENTELAIYIKLLDDKCPFLDELITALYLFHIKGISSIQNTNTSNVQISLPGKPVFIHNILIQMAKSFYEKPQIFRDNNKTEKARVAQLAIDAYITKSLPVKDILNAYIAGSVHPSSNGNIVVLQSNNPNSSLIEQVKMEISNIGSNLLNNNHNGIHEIKNLQSRNMSLPHDDPVLDSTAVTTPFSSSEESENSTSPSNSNDESNIPDTASSEAPPSVLEITRNVEPEEKTIVESAPTPKVAAKESTVDIFPEIVAPITVASTQENSLTTTTIADTKISKTKTVKIAVSPVPSSTKATTTVNKKAKSKEKDKITVEKTGDTTKKQQQPKKMSVTTKAQAKKASSSDTVSTSNLSKKQQRELLDEILRYTRTKELVTPSFFSDAESKET
jgi:Family of unknown function (DUF5764)